MQWGTNNPHPDLAEQRERLSAWLDGALDSAERATLERHVNRCAWCRHELAALRQTRELLRALPEPRVPRSFALPLAGPLPVAPTEEGAPLRETFAPASAAALTSAPAGRSDRAIGRWAWAIQRVGGIAAALGLSLIVGNAILSHSAQPASASLGPSLGASAPASTGSSQGPGAGLPGHTHATPVPTHTYEDRAANHDGATTAPPVLPLAGAGLLGGGTIMLVAGIAASRHRDRQSGAA